MGFPLTISGGIPGLRQSDWDITVPENLAGAASPSPEALTASVSSGVEEAGLPEWERRVPQGSPVSWGLLRAPTGSTPGQNRVGNPVFQTHLTGRTDTSCLPQLPRQMQLSLHWLVSGWLKFYCFLVPTS